VLAAHVGGAFGAKSELTMEAIAAIELSRTAGRPVRLALTREEEFAFGGYRPAIDLDVALQVDAAGAMQGLSVSATADGGIAIGSTAAAIVRFIYPDVPKRIRDYDVVSHTLRETVSRSGRRPGVLGASSKRLTRWPRNAVSTHRSEGAQRIESGSPCLARLGPIAAGLA
jgi:hypothetical protein